MKFGENLGIDSLKKSLYSLSTNLANGKIEESGASTRTELIFWMYEGATELFEQLCDIGVESEESIENTLFSDKMKHPIGCDIPSRLVELMLPMWIDSIEYNPRYIFRCYVVMELIISLMLRCHKENPNDI